MPDNMHDVQIKPKVLPFRCPVCRGFGTVNYGKKQCNSCKGKGYILVDQEEKRTYGIDEITQ